MSGMRALGRLYDVVPIAAGGTVKVSFKDVAGIGVCAAAASTATTSLTVKIDTSYAGSGTLIQAVTGASVPDTWYQRTAATAAWTKQSASWSSSVLTLGATSGYISYVDFLVSDLPDTYDYISFTTANAAGAVVLYDRLVQRTPENLRIPSA